MSRKLLSYTAIGLILGSTAIADVPKVAVDIAPVHSLVSRVMEGVGSPKLIIPAGASPHEYSLRPSEAKSLQDADMVIWMGEDLAPWMENSIETLSKNAEVITLLEESDTKLLDFREGALFEEHDHGDHDDHDHTIRGQCSRESESLCRGYNASCTPISSVHDRTKRSACEHSPLKSTSHFSWLLFRSMRHLCHPEQAGQPC